MGKAVLHLHLKFEYFDAIKAGTKKVEYRLASKWLPRLQDKIFDEVWLYRGYPPKDRHSQIIRRQWNGFHLTTRQHKHFGPDAVDVLAIDVSKPLHTKGTT